MRSFKVIAELSSAIIFSACLLGACGTKGPLTLPPPPPPKPPEAAKPTAPTVPTAPPTPAVDANTGAAKP